MLRRYPKKADATLLLCGGHRPLHQQYYVPLVGNSRKAIPNYSAYDSKSILNLQAMTKGDAKKLTNQDEQRKPGENTTNNNSLIIEVQSFGNPFTSRKT